MSADDAFHSFGQMVQQVPGVGHLPGLRGACAGAVTERAGAVAAGDPHLGVIAQPGGEGVRGAAHEDVDGTVGVHVNEDRRVGVTAAYGELVDSPSRNGP